MTKNILFLLLVFAASATLQSLHAQVSLAPIIVPTLVPAEIDPFAPAIPCAEITMHLDKYAKMVFEHSQSLNSFLDQISGKMNEWYAQLNPLEDSKAKIPVGAFSVLQDGSSQISDLSRMADDNASLLASEIANIISSLKTCKIGTTTMSRE